MLPDAVPAKPAKVTLNDVAMLAGVDRSVVSRVINNDPKLNVRPETRQRVRDTIEKLGYRPNVAARSLRTARAYMFGLLIPDFADPVCAEIIKGTEQAARQLGRGLMTASTDGVRLGLEHYLNLLGQGRVDGVLFAGEVSGRELAQLRAAQVPYVLVNRLPADSRRYVVVDDERAAQLAIEHLVSLGHRRIGHLAGPERSDPGRRRHAGYLTAIAHAGLPVHPELVVPGDDTAAGGAAALRRLMSTAEPPTALLVADVGSAVGALHAAHALGLSVPRDLSLVTLHDMPLASHLVPPLTTVRMPLRELGRRALELLARRGPEDVIAEVVAEPVELVERASTAPPR